MSVVQVRDLAVAHRGGGRRALDDIAFDIDAGETFGVVGASGAGKSTLALALVRALPKGAELTSRRLEVGGHDVLALAGDGLRRYRRDTVGVVFQEPGRALNPTMTVGAQVAESHVLAGVSRRAAGAAAIGSLEDVGLTHADTIARRYAHELSGGQQQRVMIAMAVVGRPQLLVLDEPTASLDGAAKDGVLDLVARLQAERGFATLLISHDLALVAARCDRVGVLDDGRLVEVGSARALLAAPEHPRTRALVGASVGWASAMREPIALDAPAVVVGEGIGARHGRTVVLDDVHVRLHRGETLGIVGETGSGKTTLGRVLAGLHPHSGDVRVAAPTAPPPVQMVFQSPDASLNPRRTVRQTLRRAIELLHSDATPEQLLDRTGMPHAALDRLPHELSGGEKQRVAIARAFAGHAPVVVCDEPTSSLDTTARGAILDLLVELQRETGASYVFISHDLDVIRRVAHRVAVLRRGRVVDTAAASDFFSRSPASRTQAPEW